MHLAAIEIEDVVNGVVLDVPVIFFFADVCENFKAMCVGVGVYEIVPSSSYLASLMVLTMSGVIPFPFITLSDL